MNLYRHLDELPRQFLGGALSIGNFDGVHLGHARLAERLAAMARQMDGPAVVLTFDPSPSRILHPEQAPALLGWTERKAQLLIELGVDAVLAYPTDRALLQLEAREFFDQIIRDRLQARAMVEGPNFFFGHNRSGTVDLLRQFCDQAAMRLDVVEPVRIEGQIVSSSRVRALIGSGAIDRAAQMLGRAYRIRGTVIRGAGRGAKLGYPTANIGQIVTLLPGEGIYACRARVKDAWWPAAVNVGPNPTFDEGTLKVEAYLLEFQGEIYDQPIELDFLARLRDIERFDSVDQLIEQMDRDVDATRQVVQQHTP